MNTLYQIDITLVDKHRKLLMLDCDGKDQVVKAVKMHGWKGYEPPLPLLIGRLCTYYPQPAIFIDVGANTGYYSLLAAVLDAKCVWSFEPVPYIRKIFDENVKASKLESNINISSMAISDSIGEFEMYLPDDSHGLIETSASLNPSFRNKHIGKVNVATTTIDSFFLNEHKLTDDNLIIIKIDVESLEESVIKGMTEFIKKFRPVLIVELLPGIDVEFFLKFKQETEYDHYWLNPNNTLDKMTSEIGLSLSRRDHLFVPQEKTALLFRAMSENIDRLKA